MAEDRGPFSSLPWLSKQNWIRFNWSYLLCCSHTEEVAHKGPTRSEWSKRELKGSSPGLCEHSATHSAVLLSALESHMIDRKGGKKKIILLRAVEQQIGVSQKVLSNSSLKVPKTGHKTQCSWILYGNSRWCTSVDFWLPLSLLCSWWINTLGSSYHNLYFVGSYLMLNFTEQQREAGWSGG